MLKKPKKVLDHHQQEKELWNDLFQISQISGKAI